MKTLLLLVQKTWYEFGEDNASQMAAAITYYVLFAVVPLTIFVLSLAAIALDEEQQDEVVSAVEGYLNTVPEDVTISAAGGATNSIENAYGADGVAKIEAELEAINADPNRAARAALAQQIEAGEAVEVAGNTLQPEQLTVKSESEVADAIDRISGSSGALGVIGFILMAFSASVAFGAIRRSLNFVWGVPHRPFAQQRLTELSMLFGLVVLLGAAIAVTTIVQLLAEASENPQNPLSGVGSFLWFATGFVLPWTLMFVLILLAYLFVPNTNNSFFDVWFAAVLASLAVEILLYGYATYVTNFSSYGPVYGALGGILLFMFLVWLSSYVFLMGAELASEYPKVMRGDYADEESLPSGPFSLRETAVRVVKSFFLAGRDK